MMALALTSKTHPYKTGFAPFPSDVYRIRHNYSGPGHRRQHRHLQSGQYGIAAATAGAESKTDRVGVAFR